MDYRSRASDRSPGFNVARLGSCDRICCTRDRNHSSTIDCPLGQDFRELLDAIREIRCHSAILTPKSSCEYTDWRSPYARARLLSTADLEEEVTEFP